MMKETELPDQEPTGVPSVAEPPPAKSKVGRKSVASIRRELNDKDMTHPAVAKLLLDDVERLEQDNTDLSSYRGKYHEADKRAAVLDQKLRASTSQEIVFGTCSTLGGAALGYAPAVWNASTSTGQIVLAAGIVLIICGIVAKAVKA